ncbi:MAG: D-ribose transporter ATP-binding protein [Microbacteriaceae bacterium]|nr:D-ribose transporter ATP-binding protein [Microbacteriaceae bacterium]
MSMSPPTTGQAVLELRNVAKSFGSAVALASADLRVKTGSIHALVGENDAGKSTLVKIVAGLYQRDSGEPGDRGRHCQNAGRPDHQGDR